MEPTKRSLSCLESIPDDMLRLTISKVGSASSTDFINSLLTCKSMNFSVDDPLIAKDLSLAPLVKKPLLANRYKKLMDSCLGAKNVDAHYVKGTLEYFYFKNQLLGLHHLRLASKGGQKEGRYLYGLILMALGMIEKGKKILTKLTDEEGIASVKNIWETIQNSLSELNVQMKDVYEKSYASMKPEVNCHPQEINSVCAKCFHFYLMSDFFEMVIGLSPASATGKKD
ncbi:unnamed protein product [Eruca vesicaria subsp. sativa]|uniref:At2g35280-like TPR domain-containing protein n=1 Tax=Eruca vesicaria subsp. sativa TaxID=29727 RepID=A0ABC8KZ83_ERUVS|nr:unnamed protein product [Eruca vesicaria subsp. sativa]